MGKDERTLGERQNDYKIYSDQLAEICMTTDALKAANEGCLGQLLDGVEGVSQFRLETMPQWSTKPNWEFSGSSSLAVVDAGMLFGHLDQFFFGEVIQVASSSSSLLPF
jgi:hypothetical protein